MRPTVQDRGAPTVNGTYSDCTVVTMNVNLTAKSLNLLDQRAVSFCGTLVHINGSVHCRWEQKASTGLS